MPALILLSIRRILMENLMMTIVIFPVADLTNGSTATLIWELKENSRISYLQ